jgi:molybdopterin converting factor small subunit
VATVLLPRSLLALFPGVDRSHEVGGDSVGAVIDALDQKIPGLRDRLVESGPHLRPHINVFVDGSPAGLATPVGSEAVVHVIPAVSGGS